MNKYKIILLFSMLIAIWSCAGTNATTMEYRSATTKVRSERDLNAGEVYALKALDMEEHANDARVAYFLAIEIYKPRKNWDKMKEMLDTALLKNENYKQINGKDQRLEKPFRLEDGTAVETIPDAIQIYKEELWRNLFNQTVDLVNQERFDEALEKISLAKSVLEKVDNHITGCLLYVTRDDMDNAIKDIERALELEPDNARALEIAGDISIETALYISKNPTALRHMVYDDLYYSALEYYEKALASNDTQEGLLEKLISLYVELENYDQAITTSAILLANNPDNPDTYFNLGVIYQRLGNELYGELNIDYNQLINQDTQTESKIKNTYSKCLKALDMIQLALDYFTDSSMVEVDDNPDTDRAMSEMKRLRKNIKDIYIQSIREIALKNNVTLN